MQRECPKHGPYFGSSASCPKCLQEPGMPFVPPVTDTIKQAVREGIEEMHGGVHVLARQILMAVADRLEIHSKDRAKERESLSHSATVLATIVGELKWLATRQEPLPDDLLPPGITQGSELEAIKTAVRRECAQKLAAEEHPNYTQDRIEHKLTTMLPRERREKELLRIFNA